LAFLSYPLGRRFELPAGRSGPTADEMEGVFNYARLGLVMGSIKNILRRVLFIDEEI